MKKTDKVKKSEHSNSDSDENTSFVSELFDYYEIGIFTICAVILFFSFFIRLCRVDGQSMENTLYNNEMLIVSDMFYTPARGDIIVFHQTESNKQDGTGSNLNEPIVKRVIATEGEWISIEVVEKKLKITIFNEDMTEQFVLEEDYAKYDRTPSAGALHRYPVQVPKGCLFVLGDNRCNSTDSRFPNIGFVDARRVLGQALVRVYPFARAGVPK